MKKLYFINIMFFTLITSANFAQQDPVNSITMEEFREKLKSYKDIIVLDVRTEEELTGHLGKIGKAINIPIQVLGQRITELEPYKDKEIYVICRTQNRSAVAVSILQKNGFNAKFVLGGMAAYKEK